MSMDDSCNNDVFDDPNACPEYRQMSRRMFMHYARNAAKLGAAAIAPNLLPKVVLGDDKECANNRPRDIIVFVFKRGGQDGWNACPVTDQAQYMEESYVTQSGNESFPNGLRPVPLLGGDPRDIGLGMPDESDPDPYAVRAQHLGEVAGRTFGINKSYLDRESSAYANHETIWDLWGAGQVAFLPGAGSPDLNRSHFSAEALIEYSIPNQPSDQVLGWLTRYLNVMPSLGSPLRAAAFTQNKLLPKMLAFAPNSLAFHTIDEVVIPGNELTEGERKAILEERYEEQAGEPLKGSVLTALQTAQLLSSVDVIPDASAKYTTSDFGQRCMNAAALIKACIDIEVIELETYGHDSHAYQGPTKIDPVVYDQQGILTTTGGGYYNRIKDYSQNIAAFSIDCAKFWDRICIIEQPEFGRQINMNGTWGTDHANAGLMCIMGGRVNGGIYSKESLGGADGFPSFDPDNMGDNHDEDGVHTTIDSRQVISEILRKCMGVDQTTIDTAIFSTDSEEPPPAVPFDEANELGIIQAPPE
jgi:uncharacterized protein (DUF1501 family)